MSEIILVVLVYLGVACVVAIVCALLKLDEDQAATIAVVWPFALPVCLFILVYRGARWLR